MKKLVNVIILTLALNFLAIAGAVGWLAQTGRLDRTKVAAIKEVLFPKPEPPAPATQPVEPATQPTLKLEELLARHTGRSAAEQVEFIQNAFDTQTAQLDRRRRELSALQDAVDKAAAKLARDRAQLEADRAALAAREQQATRLASDKGFQDSLERYTSMPTKQVKAIFMTLEDETVMDYLQSMPPRTAARIAKEFKSPEEQEKLQRVMELMRQPPTTAPSAPQQASADANR